MGNECQTVNAQPEASREVLKGEEQESNKPLARPSHKPDLNLDKIFEESEYSSNKYKESSNPMGSSRFNKDHHHFKDL